MRTFLSALAVFALACASAQADPLVVNDIVDALLWRLSHNEHITSLPDLEEAAEVKMLFWNTSVRINANNGALVGSVALKRFGDATMVIDDVKDLSVHVEIGFDEAVLGYEYKTEVAGVKGPGGRFNATVGATSVEGRIVLELTTDFCHVMFLGLKIAKLGEIEVQHGGSNVVNAVYHKLLVDMLVKERLSVLQEGIDALVYSLGYDCNKILPSISLPIS